jgi:mono/diheme cytochrome c family protein
VGLRSWALLLSIPLVVTAAVLITIHGSSASETPTYYKDVLPILQDHCQSCHRPGAMAPMPLMTYEQVQPWIDTIGVMVQTKKMPPWFADPKIGHFSNDPSLTPAQIQTIADWVRDRGPMGNPQDAPMPRRWTKGWSIAEPDLIVRMPKPVAIHAHGDMEYTYEIVPTHFKEDRWVQMAELKPSNLEQVHHAVVYIRPPDSQWLRRAPVGVPFTASMLKDPQERREAEGTTSDLLIVYTPGASPERWQEGMAKFIPAGSDLVFQMHYMTMGHASTDQSSLGLVFAKNPPKQRVVTLQLNDHAIIIPPNTDNFRVEVEGSIPNDCTLLSLFPHMHLRGKRFEFDIVHPDGSIEPLLRVNYNFHWQLTYRLAKPLFLKAGTVLRAVAWYDNSRNNPNNPDPNVTVTWGDQTRDEMMIGFFDVAIPAGMNKWQFFQRHSPSPLLGQK